MTKVVLGEWVDGKTRVQMDVDRFVESRGLIQASSGSGKSVLLRKVLEVTHPHIQQFVIDPEGEFASLRETCDLIIAAARDGDVVASPKTAGLLAIRLLETHASAVLDISELKVRERHAFVRIFFEAMINAPKALWHPVLVALDEAHMFAPEKGQGESEALDAVIDMASLGRKRGFALLPATQRIGKYHKSAAADLKNRLIGNTALDVDVKRAAFDLGITPKEALAILRPLPPGHFYAFGPAFGRTEPAEILVAMPKTSHPKIGHKQRVAPPKPSDAIKALLPKLADLRREAEEEARTVADLQRELATTRKDLKQALRQQPKPEAAPKVDQSAVRAAAATNKRLRAQIEEAMKFIVKINATGFAKDAGVDPADLRKAIDSAVGQAMKLVDAKTTERERAIQGLQRDAGRLIAAAQKLLADETVEVKVDVKHQEPFAVSHPTAPRARSAAGSDSTVVTDGLTPVQQKVLNALAEAEQLGAEAPPRTLVAILSGYTHVQSTGFVKALGSLSSADLITYPPGSRVALTDAGRAASNAPDRPSTAEELQARVINLIGGAASKVLKPLIDANRDPMRREDLATASGYGHVQSTGFVKTLGRLRTLGFIDYPESGMVVAQPVLFLEHAS